VREPSEFDRRSFLARAAAIGLGIGAISAIGTLSPALAATWVDSLGVGAYGRGKVVGLGLVGMKAGFTYTVALANDQTQYWGVARAATGAFSIDKVRPGPYTLTVYKGELAVYSTDVRVAPGAVTRLHPITITADPSDTATIWRIGDWDGTPSGFKNAPLMTFAHPSDRRALPWTGDFVVGRSPSGAFPCCLWKDVNNNQTISFKLTSAQAAVPHIVRIGITANFAGALPRIRVNNWTSAAPSDLSARSVTHSFTAGTYRENNTSFSYPVPAGAWQHDVGKDNVLTIELISETAGTGFLSPGVSFDCVELQV
jgi:rhamnogalacturonan endolyase